MTNIRGSQFQSDTFCSGTKKKVQWNPKNDEISKIDNRFWSIYKRILFLIKFEIQKRS